MTLTDAGESIAPSRFIRERQVSNSVCRESERREHLQDVDQGSHSENEDKRVLGCLERESVGVYTVSAAQFLCDLCVRRHQFVVIIQSEFTPNLTILS